MPKKYSRAFTLIELVIYIALSSYLLTGMLLSVYLFSEEASRGETNIYLMYEGDFIQKIVTTAIQNTPANSNFFVSTSTQTLTIVQPDTESELIGSSNGSFFIETSNRYQPYSSNLVQLSNTQFSISTSSTSSSTTISFSFFLSATTTQGVLESEQFSETVATN